MSLVLWLIIFTFSSSRCQTFEPEDEIETVLTADVSAVMGKSATLPCDIEPGKEYKDDRISMVLWYKEGGSKPIYGFDVRGRSYSKARYWSDPDVFGPRAYFVTVSKPAALNIDGVQISDQGVYRCRVDFKKTPSRNFAVNLTVIVPPHQLLIYDSSGRDVNNGVIGPLEEGTDLTLTCEVRGGKPVPTVSWFINDRMVDGRVSYSNSQTVTINKFERINVKREHLNSTFKCQASNTKLMMPVEKSVRLELILKPLSILMPEKPRQMMADQEYIIQCHVRGSRPKATITWTRDNRLFRRGKIVDEGNDTMVISSVTFAPVPEDDGTILKCIGDNPKLAQVGIEDSFKLNVVYAPQVSLHLGTTLNPDDIKEGDDVYFECLIKANPKEHKISWFHDGAVVTQNMSLGIIISTHSLVLQRVTKNQSGAYHCSAANSQGEKSSASVKLRVRYAPICKQQDITVIGASISEVLRVKCQVSADPPKVEFVWQFNNSGESFDVSHERLVTSSGNYSELMYTASTPRDYGTLTCWGKNDIGRQAEPCVFHVVPAEKPGPLTNCTLHSPDLNKTNELLEITCKEGNNGGLPQIFILEAYDVNNRMKLRLNQTSVSSEMPLFRIDLSELPPWEGTPPALRIVVYAQNAKGKSDSYVLEDIMLNDAEKRTDGGTAISMVPLAALLTGLLLTVGLGILIAIVVAIRKRHQHCGGAHCALQIDPKQSKPPEGSLLEINTGDNRYVVAYTVKSTGDSSIGGLTLCSNGPTNVERQPDILNTPRGGEVTTPPSSGGPLPRPDALFTPPGERPRQSPFQNTSFQSPLKENYGTIGRTRPRPKDMSYSTFATMRRDHIIADSIPGPESCV